MKNSKHQDLTQRQRDILAVIAAFILVRGYPPTLRDLQDATGIRSPEGIKCHLVALRCKGAVAFDDRCARTLRVVKKESDG